MAGFVFRLTYSVMQSFVCIVGKTFTHFTMLQFKPQFKHNDIVSQMKLTANKILPGLCTLQPKKAKQFLSSLMYSCINKLIISV